MSKKLHVPKLNPIPTPTLTTTLTPTPTTPSNPTLPLLLVGQSVGWVGRCIHKHIRQTVRRVNQLVTG